MSKNDSVVTIGNGGSLLNVETGLQEVAESIREKLSTLDETDRSGDPANIVDSIYFLARSFERAVNQLGNADAGTPMGALEAHGAAIMGAANTIADALHDVAEAIREGQT